MIRSGTQFLATHGYKKNPDGPVGNELMNHDDNEHWWLVDEGKGQVVYVPVVYLVIDDTLHEEESDTTRKGGHEKWTDRTKIGGEMGQNGKMKKISIQRQ